MEDFLKAFAGIVAFLSWAYFPDNTKSRYSAGMIVGFAIGFCGFYHFK